MTLHATNITGQDATRAGEPLLESAREADAAGADARAVRLLHEALARPAWDEPAAGALALAHLHAGRLASAGRSWWRICRRNARNVEALAGLLVCGLATGHGQIVEHAQRALAIHASRVERQQALARMWQHAAGGMVIAREMSGKARRPTEPRSPLMALLAKAAGVLERTAELHPRRADAQYHLAACQEALGRVAEAAEGVERALAINPQYAAAARLAEKLRAG